MYTSTAYQHSYVLGMSGLFFDRLNPFKGSASVDHQGFRVPLRATLVCATFNFVQQKGNLAIKWLYLA